jgi:AmmeMemoRadiSam system protein B
MSEPNMTNANTRSVRPAAVAGMFYPGDAGQLSGEVAGMLRAATDASTTALLPKAIIAPHAGYIYSGPIAASVYALLKQTAHSIRRVVLLGPTHRVGVNGLALPSVSHFSTPLGTIEIDQEARAMLADLPQVLVADPPHAQEHSLEVQLPFLQSVLPNFRLVPLAVGHASAEAVAAVLDRLWGGPETLIVVSSDLSHYLPYTAAQEIDRRTAARIVACDPTIGHEEACGATPVNGLLLAARQHGLKTYLIDLRNSGDTAGDRSRVVGYGGFAFAETIHEH